VVRQDSHKYILSYTTKPTMATPKPTPTRMESYSGDGSGTPLTEKMVLDKEREVEAEEVPMLTMTNWHSEFKDKFIDYCYDYGEATSILMNGEDPMQLEEPKYEDTMIGKDKNVWSGSIERIISDI
jgi:hypothetical protein